MTSNLLVSQVSLVSVEIFGVHTVVWVSVNLMLTTLSDKTFGNRVPVNSMRSPPSTFRFVDGVTEATVQSIYSLATPAFNGIRPIFEMKIGSNMPQVGVVSSVHSRLVAVSLVVSKTQFVFAN